MSIIAQADFLITYLNYADLKYGLNSVEMQVITFELSEIISRFEEIIDKIKRFKVISIFKKKDRIGLIIEFENIQRFMIIKFVNIGSNIYEFYIIVI